MGLGRRDHCADPFCHSDPPKVQTMTRKALAAALGCQPADLMDPEQR